MEHLKHVARRGAGSSMVPQISKHCSMVSQTVLELDMKDFVRIAMDPWSVYQLHSRSLLSYTVKKSFRKSKGLLCECIKLPEECDHEGYNS